ncbi:MAG: hypothetical protein K6U80_08385 [Firmicutes bacterium]|nr:hypothetical protein [Bacillota bacterium]
MNRGQRIIRFLVIIIVTVFWIFVSGSVGGALPDKSGKPNPENPPLVIVSIDKADSLELWNSQLPSIKQLTGASACGLMNIRSGAGYGNSGSGYLTLGSGSRATMPGLLGGAFEGNEALPGGTANQYLAWTYGGKAASLESQSLKIPEAGWITNQALAEDHPVAPGSLGAIFRSNGWQTCLIGGQDNPLLPDRPGGLLLMDHQGIIDEGAIHSAINEKDPGFPYLSRFSTTKTINELRDRMAPKKLFLIEYGDFARLDSYQYEMLPGQYQKLKELTWVRFDQFLGELLRLQKNYAFSIILLSPSVSKEGITRKNLLAPIVINAPQYPPGLLTSGTTKWPGLVANIDVLPAMVKLAGFKFILGLQGRVISVKPEAGHIRKLQELNWRLIGANSSQRGILDWYMGIIAACWIGGLLFYYLKKEAASKLLLTGLLVIPLALIGLPLLPLWAWSVCGFLGFTLILTVVFNFINPLDKRTLILSGLIWSALILDQIMGWPLIRYSPLGYSAMAGSRYYGMGNEFMGVFLAVSLILAGLIYQKTGFKWPAFLISGLTIAVLSLPQLGAKFGGILAGSVGFSFYLIQLFRIDFKDRRLWLGLGGLILFLAAVSWWDSLRPAEVRTHIGRFIGLFFSRDFGQVGQTIFRKLSMNLKLTMSSPWIRIVILAFLLGMIHRVVTKARLTGKEDVTIWGAILVTGATAYLVNDAGVLAFATCLAYGFSFILLRLNKNLLGQDLHDL